METPLPRRARSGVSAASAAAVAAVAVMVAALLFAASPKAEAATLTPEPSFGDDPGNLSLYTYVPEELAEDAPLVVPLHGCAQDATEYHDHSGWAEHADEHGFALAYPEQSSGNNATNCFNWFEPDNVARDSGEAQSIRSMVEYALDEYGLDDEQVYASGLSAGGAMAGELLAAYPDVFAGGSIVAGIPVGCATSMVDAFTCMNPGVTQSPEEWGDEVRAKHDWDDPWPRVAIWHGTSDTTVAPANADASVDQWLNAGGLPDEPDATDELPGSTTAEYYGGDAETAQVANFSVSGMGHGTPVDPSSDCGATGAYFLDTVCSTGYTVEFWGIGESDGGGDPDPTPSPTGDPEPGECVTADNYTHVAENRAEQELGQAYALGSGDPLGLWSAGVTTSVTEVEPDYWENSPDGC